MKEPLDASIQAKKFCIYKVFRTCLQKRWENIILENHDLVEKSSFDKLNLKFPFFQRFDFLVKLNSTRLRPVAGQPLN